MTFSGTATDDGTIKSVYVALLNNSTGESLTVDGTWGIDNGLNLYKLPVTPNVQSYDWSWTTPQDLTPGNYTFAVLATDDEGITTPQVELGADDDERRRPGDATPDATLATQGAQVPSENLTLNLTGQATDDAEGRGGAARPQGPRHQPLLPPGRLGQLGVHLDPGDAGHARTRPAPAGPAR